MYHCRFCEDKKKRKWLGDDTLYGGKLLYRRDIVELIRDMGLGDKLDQAVYNLLNRHSKKRIIRKV